MISFKEYKQIILSEADSSPAQARSQVNDIIVNLQKAIENEVRNVFYQIGQELLHPQTGVATPRRGGLWNKIRNWWWNTVHISPEWNKEHPLYRDPENTKQPVAQQSPTQSAPTESYVGRPNFHCFIEWTHAIDKAEAAIISLNEQNYTSQDIDRRLNDAKERLITTLKGLVQQQLQNVSMPSPSSVPDKPAPTPNTTGQGTNQGDKTVRSMSDKPPAASLHVPTDEPIKDPDSADGEKSTSPDDQTIEEPLPPSVHEPTSPSKLTHRSVHYKIPDDLIHGKYRHLIHGMGRTRDQGAFTHNELYDAYKQAGGGAAGGEAVKNRLRQLVKISNGSIGPLTRIIKAYGWKPNGFNILRWGKKQAENLIDHITHYVRTDMGEDLPDPWHAWRPLGYKGPDKPHGVHDATGEAGHPATPGQESPTPSDQPNADEAPTQQEPAESPYYAQLSNKIKQINWDALHNDAMNDKLQGDAAKIVDVHRTKENYDTSLMGAKKGQDQWVNMFMAGRTPDFTTRILKRFGIDDTSKLDDLLKIYPINNDGNTSIEKPQTPPTSETQPTLDPETKLKNRLSSDKMGYGDVADTIMSNIKKLGGVNASSVASHLLGMDDNSLGKEIEDKFMDVEDKEKKEPTTVSYAPETPEKKEPTPVYSDPDAPEKKEPTPVPAPPDTKEAPPVDPETALRHRLASDKMGYGDVADAIMTNVKKLGGADASSLVSRLLSMDDRNLGKEIEDKFINVDDKANKDVSAAQPASDTQKSPSVQDKPQEPSTKDVTSQQSGPVAPVLPTKEPEPESLEPAQSKEKAKSPETPEEAEKNVNKWISNNKNSWNTIKQAFDNKFPGKDLAPTALRQALSAVPNWEPKEITKALAFLPTGNGDAGRPLMATPDDLDMFDRPEILTRVHGLASGKTAKDMAGHIEPARAIDDTMSGGLNRKTVDNPVEHLLGKLFHSRDSIYAISNEDFENKLRKFSYFRKAGKNPQGKKIKIPFADYWKAKWQHKGLDSQAARDWAFQELSQAIFDGKAKLAKSNDKEEDDDKEWRAGSVVSSRAQNKNDRKDVEDEENPSVEWKKYVDTLPVSERVEFYKHCLREQNSNEWIPRPTRRKVLQLPIEQRVNYYLSLLREVHGK